MSRLFGKDPFAWVRRRGLTRPPTAICDASWATELTILSVPRALPAKQRHAHTPGQTGLAPMKVTPPKLSAPALQDNVVPTQVLKRMRRPDTLNAHWLFAGPGAGKTQLARLWLQQVGRPYAWLQLDAQDNDPLIVLEQLRIALQALVQPLVLLPSYSPQSGVSLQRHCEYLWETLLDTLQQPCVIVLDDAHHILAWPEHPVLHSLMKGLDTRAHLLVLSRNDLDDRYARDVVNRRIHRIEPSCFAWRQPQLRAWLKQRWGIMDVDEQTAESLLTISQGRAAILALLDIRSLLNDRQSLAKQAAKQLELSELMESSLLARLAPHDRASLFLLACLASFPSQWLYTLGFSLVVQKCVSMWQHNSSVVHSLERNQDEWRFHPLFAEILRAAHDPAQEAPPGLRNRIIDVCVMQGRNLDAIALCRNTGAWDRYWQLLQPVGLGWLEQGQIASLRQALTNLPIEARAQFVGPSLSLFTAATALAKQPNLAYQEAIRALHQSQARPELRAVWVHALAIASQSVIATGTQLSALNPVIDALDGAIDCPWFLELPAQLRLLALGAGMIASIAGQDRPPMRRLCQETERAMLECENVDLQAATVSALARVVVLHGLPEYLDWVRQQIARVEHLASSPAAQLSLLHAKMHNAQAKGAFATAEQLARTLWQSRSPEVPLIWLAETLASGAFNAASCQKIPQMKRYSELLLKLRQQCDDSSTNFRMHSYVYQACTAAHEGRWRDALQHYEHAVQMADEYRYSLMQVCTRCCLAFLRIELGMLQGVASLRAEIESLLEKTPLPLSHRVYASLKAFEHIRKSPAAQAITPVREFLEQMESTDQYIQVAAMLPQYAELLGFALTHNIKPELIKKIIRRGLIYPKKRPHPQWPAYIEVRTLGRFDIKINGEDARNRLVSSGRRFELLTALLWWGGKELRYDDCIEWIWPHLQNRSRALRSIKTALKRLNDDLGRNDAILEHEGKISLNPELWNYDAIELQRSFSSAEGRAEFVSQLTRGFIGPTPIPQAMRKVVPTQGSVDLGPRTLLEEIA